MDPRVREFHYILPPANVASVMRRGIWCREMVGWLRPRPVPLRPGRTRRNEAQVPNGRKLSQYARLYFDAHNPLLRTLVAEGRDVCVLRLSHNVLCIRDVVLADRDAGHDFVRFLAPEQWEELRLGDILAGEWRQPADPVVEWRCAELKSAELLSPESVEPEFVIGAYVPSDDAAARLQAAGFEPDIHVHPSFFFQPEDSQGPPGAQGEEGPARP